VLGALVALRLPGVIRRLGSTLRVADAFGLASQRGGMVKALESGSVDPVFAVVLGATTGSGAASSATSCAARCRRCCGGRTLRDDVSGRRRRGTRAIWSRSAGPATP